MSERAPVTPQKMEEKLNGLYYSAVSPDPAFADRLRAQLLDRAGKLPRQDTTRPWTIRSALKSTWHWGMSLAGLGLLVVVLVFSIHLILPSNIQSVKSSTPSATTSLLSDIPFNNLSETFQASASPTSTPMPTPAEIVVSPKSCAASVEVPPTGDQFLDRPARALGGGSLQSGNFIFDLWLICSPTFSRSGWRARTSSEIDGLGIYAAWLYQGSQLEGEIYYFAGIEPYVEHTGTSGPSLEPFEAREDELGIQFPVNVFPDFSQGDTSLKYVYKVKTPDGFFYGAALLFTLQPALDGYQPVNIQVTALTGQELTDEPASPTSTPPFPIRAWTEIHPLLQEIQDLKARSNETLLNGSGWVHLTSKNTSRQETWTLPNGATFPPETLEDSWYLLNDSLQVVALVTRILDLTGNTLQVSVLENDVSYNLTLDIEFKLVQPFFINLDYGFPETAARAVKMGGSFTKHEIPLDGESTGLQFVIQDEHWKKVAVYDPQTGQLHSLESWSKNAIGEETLESSTTILTYERVAELPTDIRSYFQEEHKAYRPLPPQGTPTPPGFDPSQSELTVRTIAGDNANQPNFWYGDIYADGYLLGRVDFGALPGGQCDRSADGSKLAFMYAVVVNGTLAQAGLRWFDLSNIEDIHAPAPDLELLSPVAWAQQGDWSAFFACKPDKSACGLYLLDTITDQVRLVTDAGFSTIFPLWKPDGTQISFVNNVDDIYTLLVVDVVNGEIVYRGTFDVDAWRIPSDAPTNQWGVEIPRGYTQNRCFQTK